MAVVLNGFYRCNETNEVVQVVRTYENGYRVCYKPDHHGRIHEIDRDVFEYMFRRDSNAMQDDTTADKF